jgi:dihydrofolate reductase
MSKLVVRCFSVSLDGYGAGPDQDLENPLGVGGHAMFQWFFPTRTFQTMVGKEGGTTDINEEFARRGFENVGASIMGRNMFGPIRGNWPDDQWKGWWGDEPPYHSPVFVLTHYAREPLVMAGGTTFYFVTEGVEVALRRAREAAGGKDIRLGGGVSTIRQYLYKGLIDEMHLAVAPVLLGRGESLFAGMDLPALGYQTAEHTAGPGVTHIIVTRK